MPPKPKKKDMLCDYKIIGKIDKDSLLEYYIRVVFYEGEMVTEDQYDPVMKKTNKAVTYYKRTKTFPEKQFKISKTATDLEIAKILSEKLREYCKDRTPVTEQNLSKPSASTNAKILPS